MAQHSGIFISNSSNFSDVPVPSGRNIAYFLNANDDNALYGMRSDRSVFPINSATQMKTLKTTLTVAQIQAGTNVIILPKAATGFVNNVSQVTLDLPVYGGVAYDPNSYFGVVSSNELSIELMNEDPNTFSVLTSTLTRQTSIGFNTTFITPFYSNVFMSVPYDLMIRANGAGVAGNSIIDVIVYYNRTKLDQNV